MILTAFTAEQSTPCSLLEPARLLNHVHLQLLSSSNPSILNETNPLKFVLNLYSITSVLVSQIYSDYITQPYEI